MCGKFIDLNLESKIAEAIASHRILNHMKLSFTASLFINMTDPFKYARVSLGNPGWLLVNLDGS